MELNELDKVEPLRYIKPTKLRIHRKKRYRILSKRGIKIGGLDISVTLFGACRTAKHTFGLLFNLLFLQR